MRVECTSIADFLEHLKVPGCVVFGNVIYVDQNTHALDGANKRDSVRFLVTFQTSVVIDLNEGGQYLLQAGEECGVDVRDAIPENNGTEKANQLRSCLRDFCTERGITLLPGKVSE